MHDEGGAFFHRWRVAESSPSFKVDKSGHFPFVDGFHVESAADLDTVEEGVAVFCFGEDVGDDGSERCVIGGS